MKRFFKGKLHKVLSFIIAVSVILSGGMFTAVRVNAEVTGYWFFMGNGGEILFSPYGGYDCPHTRNGSLNQDMTSWKQKITFPVTAVRRLGYTLAAWNTKADGTGFTLPNTYAGGSINMSDSSVYLFAQWTPIVYSVNWDANGGSASKSSTSVAFDDKISSGGIPVASRESDVSDGYRHYYEFAGWYTSPSGGEPLTEDSVQVYGGSTYYAHWNVTSVPLNYVLYFNGNGGSASESQRTVARGSAYGSLPAASKSSTVSDGYTSSYEFAGWYTAASGGSQVSASTIMQAGDTTVYAHWNRTVSANEYTLNFNGNGGSVSEVSRTVKRGQAYGKLPSASRSNTVSDGYTYRYEFAGWYTALTGGEQVTSSTVMGAGNATVYAHWNTVTSANAYTLTFDGNGGTSSLSSRNIIRGQAYGALPSASRPADVKNGYKTIYNFLGWYTSAGGGSKVSENTIMGAGGQIVYAHWQETTTPITYKVSFCPNTGSGSMPMQTVTYGKTALLDGNKFSKTGYMFAGWSYSENGSKAFDDENAILNLTQNDGEEITLYALWKPMAFEAVCYDVLLDKDMIGDFHNGRMPEKSDLKVLGEHTWDETFGETADSVRLGCDETIGAYYKGTRYISGTSAVVTENGCILYRYFEDFSSSKLDGVILESGSNSNDNQLDEEDGKDKGDLEDGSGDDAVNNENAFPDKANNKQDIVIRSGKNVEELHVTRECGANVIADGAFRESRDTLRDVRFENATVERIGDRAFEGCNGLKCIEFPYSLTCVGDDAFSGCNNLEKIVFRNPNCEIGKNSLPQNAVIHGFEGSTAVEYAKKNNLKYEIITEIGEGYFENEVSMKNFTVPATVAEIFDNAFKNCDSLNMVAFDGMDTIIGSSAGIKEGTYIKCYAGSKAFEFADSRNYPIVMCVGFETDGVTKLKKKEYASNVSIKKLIIGEGIKSIAAQAFTGCSELEQTDVCGQKLENIETGAFENCTSLKSFEIDRASTGSIADALSYVGDGAFANTSLESFMVYNPNCIIENTAKEGYTFPISAVLQGWSKSTLCEYSSAYGNKFEEIGTSYQIVFNHDGGTGGTQKLYSYTDMDLPDITVPVKEKHIFKGYMLDEVLYYNASGVVQLSGKEIHITSDKIGRSSLSAKWEKEEGSTTPVTEDDALNTTKPSGETSGPQDDSAGGEGTASGTENDDFQGGNTLGGASSGDDEKDDILNGIQDGTGSDDGKGNAHDKDTQGGTVSGTEGDGTEYGDRGDDTASGIGKDVVLSGSIRDKAGKFDEISKNTFAQIGQGTDAPNEKKDTDISAEIVGRNNVVFAGDAVKKPVKGKIYTVGKLKYKVTKLAGRTSKSSYGCVAAAGIKRKNIKKITIPETVKICGMRMKVTAVEEKAFYKYKNIRMVTIGGNVKKIGKHAFCKCSGIKQVYIKSKKLESIGGYAFCGCQSLKRVVILSSKLKKVGKNVFWRVNRHTVLKAPAKRSIEYQKMFQK